MVKVLRVLGAGWCLAAAAACGGSSSTPSTPTTPTTPTSPTLTAPTPASPADRAQLTTLRPILTVNNGSTPSGTRTYEFQISDRSDFTPAGAVLSSYYPINVTRANIPEGTTTTSITLDVELQPATRFFWRVRLTSGATTSDWSAVRSFNSQIVGYNQPGELYDPLVNGQTIAGTPFKRTTFFPGRGLRLDDSDSYLRYRATPTIPTGEFSMDVEGLSPNPVSENPDTGKLKIMSMGDTLFDIYASKWLMTIMYRGLNGNPNNSIAFKILFGEDEDDHKLETDLPTRQAGVRLLNPGNTYYWKATWGNFIRLVVQDGGPANGGSGSGQGGTTIYDVQQNTIFQYDPNPHYAYLGVNNSGSETGSWPGAIYRNVWFGNKARPASLGSALRP